MPKRSSRQIDITRAMSQPTPLFESDGHAVYWLGNVEPSAFRTNIYLIRDGDECLLIDPGNRTYFEALKARVAQIIDPKKVTGMVLCHQDPDVAASMNDWLAMNPGMKVLTSPRTQVLLPHYGRSDYAYFNIEEQPFLDLASGNRLQFIPAPFLHFPGAFATYDAASGFLLTGDVFASLDVGSKLWAEDIDTLIENMALFHADYMASNIAARGFVSRLDGLRIRAVLPQHGSLIDEKMVDRAIEWLAGFQCGTDLIYPELS